MRELEEQTSKSQGLSGAWSRDVALYALAAGAAGVSLLALAPPAESQIVFTPANEEIGPHQKLSIDFNHDGLADLIISERPFIRSVYYGNSVRAVPHSGGGVKQGYGEGFAQAMTRGAKIAPHEEFLNNWAVIARTYGVYYNGSWPGVTEHYLGARFPIDGKLHYGWARLNVSNFGIVVTLTGYAYETQPNMPINAGQAGTDDGESDSYIPPLPLPAEQATLGTLALGAGGLPIWRSPELDAPKITN